MHIYIYYVSILNYNTTIYLLNGPFPMIRKETCLMVYEPQMHPIPYLNL